MSGLQQIMFHLYNQSTDGNALKDTFQVSSYLSLGSSNFTGKFLNAYAKK